MFDPDHQEILQRIKGRLYGYACALTRDREQAADLYQDSLVRAMTSARMPRDERAFRSWLFRILRNLWIDQMRAQRRHRELHEDTGTAQDLPDSLPDDVLVNHIAVRQAFLKLSKSHRDVLALVDIGGFSYDEAAIILDVPRGTVMSRVSRARVVLSRLLSDVNVTAIDTVRRRARDG